MAKEFNPEEMDRVSEESKMKIRQVMDIRARFTEDQVLALAEKLREAIKCAELMGYKRIAWKTLEKLGYNIEELRGGVK